MLIFTWLYLTLTANPLREGEYLVFDIKYGVVSAAQATLELYDTKYQGQDVWQIKSNTKTYSFFDVFFKVRDNIESLWQKNTLQPLRFTKNLHEGRYRQYRIHSFDHKKLKTNYQKWDFKKDRWDNKELDFPPNTQDILTAFYWVRTQNLIPGKSLFVNISSDGLSVDTEIVVHGIEKVKSIYGTKECVKIEPKLVGDAVFKQSGRIFIWLTNDKYKIPLKMQSEISFGSFVAVLKSAKNVPYKK